MSVEVTGVENHDGPQQAQLTGWRRVLRDSENVIVALALAAMVLIPLMEIVLRKAFHAGISNATAFVQHLTLAVGMLGGAIAARDGRLLSLSTLGDSLTGRWRTGVRIGAATFATTITVFLFAASVRFVVTEKEAGTILAYNIPIWIVAGLIPLGFAVVAARILRRSSETWTGRVIVLSGTIALVWLGAHPPMSPQQLVIPAFALLLVATVLGAPVFTTLGGAGLILFWGQELPIASLSIDHYRLVTNPTLPTVPLFTLAGYFLAEGGAPKRLVRVFRSLVGQFRGGPAIATCLVCALFTSFTGASGVTILALGGLLMPVLLAARYSERNALGMVTGAGSLGLLIPPCLPLILYAVIAKIGVDQIFLGGIVPGTMLVLLTACLGIWQGPKVAEARQTFRWDEARSAIWEAKWELLLPVVALVALFGGFATPVEAAAVTALYAFAIETFVYRDLKLVRDVPRVMAECGLLVGGVLLILGVALGFTNYLVDAQIPARAVEWTTETIRNPLVFLLLLNLFLLVVGCLMDIYSAIVVVVPLIVPIGAAFGIDPVHLGIIFLANLELGYLTPPVGMNLFLSSYRFHKPMPEVCRAVVPMLLVRVIGVLLITYLPPLTTSLPRLFGR